MTSPVLLDFPDSFTTERLLVRAPRPGDGAVVHAAIEESLPEITPWLPWAKSPQTLEDCERKAREFAAAWILRQDLPVYLFRRDDGTFVGGAGLHRIDWDVRRFEIGYWCRSRLVGRGYVTEATRGLRDFAFRELAARRVEVRCDALNERSVAVARRTGFVLEGTLEANYAGPDGGPRDTLVHALTRPRWEALPDVARS